MSRFSARLFSGHSPPFQRHTETEAASLTTQCARAAFRVRSYADAKRAAEAIGRA